MNAVLIAGVVLGFVAAGCGSSNGASGDPTTVPVKTIIPHPHVTTAGNTADSTAAMDFDRMFLAGMTAHHQSAIDMARVAVDKAEHPEIKKLAQDIITAQQGELVQMAGWHEEWYGEPVDGTSGMDHSTMPGMGTEGGMGVSPDELRNASPFDKAFIDAMIPHHEAAVTDARQALDRAQHQEVRGLARNIINAQQMEIDQMKQWRSTWYGS